MIEPHPAIRPEAQTHQPESRNGAFGFLDCQGVERSKRSEACHPRRAMHQFSQLVICQLRETGRLSDRKWLDARCGKGDETQLTLPDRRGRNDAGRLPRIPEGAIGAVRLATHHFGHGREPFRKHE